MNTYTPKKYGESYNYSDLPTSIKSPRYLSQLSSPRGIDQKIHQARNSIHQMINDVERKRDMTNSALEKVRSVNSEILDYFGEEQNMGSKIGRPGVSMYKSTALPEYSTQLNSRHRSPSQFEQEHFNEPYESYPRPSLQQENEQLRRLLENQCRKTEELTQEYNYLKQENSRLRSKSPNPRITSNIYDQLAQLKYENEMLRRETIRLLQRP